MGFSPSRPDLWTPLQRRILTAVAAELRGVFLTGGSALGPVHLGHRKSQDLDLFTRELERFDSLVKQFNFLMEANHLTVIAGSAGPGFRRFAVSDGTEDVPVDLAVDTTPALEPPVTLDDGLNVDSLTDIAANKLCAILGRAEIRDYVDLYFLAERGVDLVALVPAARRKDAGLDAATLSFILSEVKVNRAPAGLARTLTVEELRGFLERLRARLARVAFPGPPEP